MNDDRPVIVRTSASAQDFWSRLRADEAISPTGKVIPSRPVPSESGLGHSLLANRALTPFGKQKRPRHLDPPPPPPSPLYMLKDSRAVQMHVLREELEHAERQEFHKHKIENLREQLQRAWTVNHALVGELKKQAVRRS